MKIKVRRSQISGGIAVPGSKSHTIRAIVGGLMADGISTVKAPLESADTMSTFNAAVALGAEIEKHGEYWSITGCGGRLTHPDGPVDMGNSGTGIRLLSGVASCADFEVIFDGDESLRSRPMKALTDALQNLGVLVKTTGDGCPFSIHGPLVGGETKVDGTSSQFLSSLLFACPYARKDSIILPQKLQEKPYVGITLDWLRRLGVKLEAAADYSVFKVPGRQCFQPFEYTIPADFSTAAFPLGAAALAGRLDIKNLDFGDLQGDKAVFEYLEKMGADICRHPGVTTVEKAPLRGIDIDLNATPDALPLLAAVACLAEGTTRLLNVPQARIKETDRIACMTRELRKMGALVTELDDGMIIEGSPLHGADVEGYDDHRIVMALTVAALAADGETVINGAEAASVTYPSFLNDFINVGADIEEVKDDNL
ncbi:3-phosphoshikimate 1-carboxyvinyltransferase [Lentisphaerota bacterium ZTH]|nr:3-phosphoshikimate 1-carboxyvinyltransferase [Lentisphaerota bacterium]WET06228.1 3-phosphoshikimate 1-carboxyvinyltransferase [Lentisphaerota bacterium ZTH]